MGVRVFAPTIAELIPQATEGLYETIGEVAAGSDRQSFALDLRGEHQAVLLRDFLSKVLFLFEREARRIVSFQTIDFGAKSLSVRGESAAVDQEKSVYCREVKAVTYHELAIREVEGGFEATFIVDI